MQRYSYLNNLANSKCSKSSIKTTQHPNYQALKQQKLHVTLFRISLNNFLHLQKITVIDIHYSFIKDNATPKQTTYL